MEGLNIVNHQIKIINNTVMINHIIRIQNKGTQIYLILGVIILIREKTKEQIIRKLVNLEVVSHHHHCKKTTMVVKQAKWGQKKNLITNIRTSQVNSKKESQHQKLIIMGLLKDLQLILIRSKEGPLIDSVD